MRGRDRQFAPDQIDAGALARRERDFPLLTYDRRDLAALYLDVQRERRERQQAGDTVADRPLDTPRAQEGRRLAGGFQQLAATRAGLSAAQCARFAVDSWTNTFN